MSENQEYIEGVTEKIETHKNKIESMTLTVDELGKALKISKQKARQLTFIDGFPVLVLGRDRLTLKSGLNKWLEENIGDIW